MNHLLRLLFAFVVVFRFYAADAQGRYTISGTVRDSANGESLIGATIYVDELHNGSITNAYGFFSYTAPAGKYTIHCKMLGFAEKIIQVDLKKNIQLDFILPSEAISIKDVVIRAEGGNRNVVSSETSMQKLNVKEISSLPVIFGEKDILKTIQLLPGIKSAGEGASGFYVRGGTTDQNLVLLDEAPVYNTDHLLGFFSIFNSDALKDIKVYKGGIPAEYGGRLSSVVDIRMRDGNYKNYRISGGIGLISSRLTVEGPIIKDKGSFIVSARRTYADMFLKLASDSNQRRSTLYFYDLNMKANYRINPHNQIFLSGYLGRDYFNFGGRFGVNWGNKTATLRWNHLFSDRLFLNSTAIFSNYDYINTLEGARQQIDITSGIRDYLWKEDFQFYSSSVNTLKFGFSSAWHEFSPGSLTSKTDSTINSRILPDKKAIENAIYISDEIKIGEQAVLNLGLRYSMFSLVGPGTFYYYDEAGDIRDSIVAPGRNIVKTYSGPEPRISATWILNQNSSLKLSYMHLYQYIHLLSNTTSGNPNDLWLPTSNNILPQVTDQLAGGYFRNFLGNSLESSVEVYYKTMDHLIDYRNGADIVLNPNVESQLLYGHGWAYGAEFYLRKNDGRLTGWISYTISRTLRQFDHINQGVSYPARQDQIHDVSIVGIYQLTDRWSLGSTWVFNTGDAVTFPSGIYSVSVPGSTEILRVPYYTSRNGYRMPSYHRLDFSATYTRKKTNDRESSWNISVYNLYARKNAYAIFFQPDPANPVQMQAVRLSLFRFVPSVTYNFRF